MDDIESVKAEAEPQPEAPSALSASNDSILYLYQQ